MIGNEGDVGWKERLIPIVDMNRDVGPPEERLRQGSAVIEPDLGFHKRFAGRQVDADHAFHAQHGVVLT